MTALDFRNELEQITAEHAAGLATAEDLEAAREAYVGQAVTEIASLRGELFGKQQG